MKKTHINPARAPRFQDVLAVNIVTGIIRRFVGLPKEVVLEDLKGGQPAPYQIELAPFWGNPDLGDIRER